VVLTHVDEDELFAAVLLGFDLVDGEFPNARLGVIDKLQELGGVLMGHGARSTPKTARRG
jgi:hypothetical protein